MHNELINLLPPERINAFRRDYFLRLGSIVALVLSLLLIIHGILLAPAYFNIMQAKENQEGVLSSVKEHLASAGDQEITARLAALNKETEHLSRLGTVPSATAVIREVLALPRSGITLTGMSFTPPAGKATGQMRLTGVAASREALRSYQTTLGTVPSVSAVDLPISAYAKESEIPFTVTLSGSFTPVSP